MAYPLQAVSGYPPQQGVYPPQQGVYPPQQGGYPLQGAYPPQQGGYPPQGACPPQAAGKYPPQQSGYPPLPSGQTYSYPLQQGAPPHGAYPSGPGQPSNKGPVSNSDNDENVPTAPPIEQMQHIAGYGNTTFQTTPLLPPSYQDATRGPPSRRLPENLRMVSEDEAREALLQYVAEHCCYGSNPARDMTIRGLKPSSAFHYTLETFSESRSTAWVSAPYHGQPIDGPMNGIAPRPWDIIINPQAKFQEGVSYMEIPHTASVISCHKCHGNGRTICWSCHGQGRKMCFHCNGNGTRTNLDHQQQRCLSCSGTGRQVCMTCNGSTQIICKTCNASGQLKCHIQLTVQWKNHKDDHVVARTSLPDDKVKKVTGQMAFEEENPRVWPISHFPDNAVNDASYNLVEKHKTSFPAERILLQRHHVRIVPVTRVAYDWKENSYKYHVYGFENKVYAPDYPQKCCGCTIL